MKGLICKRRRKYESINIEVICSELTISNRNWIIFSIYRSPDYSNLLAVFKELENNVNQASESYDNFIVIEDFCSLFSLAYIKKSDTYFTKFHSSTIDLFLKNKPNFFQKTNTIETDLSDHYKLICTFF